MFTKARLKLTIWYLFIIMSVSLLFSFVIYSGINAELQQFERLTMVKTEQDFFGTRIRRTPAFEPKVISQTRQKLLLTLGLINLGILVVSGISGFLLAGKTLKPIQLVLEEQKRFIADASHELRTPLTAMRTEIEVALRDKKLNLSEARKIFRSNLEETNKMQNLSNNLLSLSRYEVRKMPMKKTNLSQTLSATMEKIGPVAARKKVEIGFDLKDVYITGNPDSLQELSTILIDNAVKYSHIGGKVLIKVSKSGIHARLTIQDFGVGIEKEDLPHIFDRFYRADSSRSEKEGYGLGLSIAKSIVDLHHGKINVTSSPGQGSTFIVTI